MKIVVNRLLCDGNGLCAEQAPLLLVLDENDTLHILQETFDEAYLDRARQAVQVCPKAALSIADS